MSSRMAATTTPTAMSTAGVRPGPWVRSAASIACTIQAPGHPVQGQGQGYRVIEPETVRTCRARHVGPRPVYHETMGPARM